MDRDRARLGRCPSTPCPLHDRGCRLGGEGVPAGRLAGLLEPGGALDQRDCALLAILLRRLRPGHAPAEGGPEGLSRLFLLLQRIAGSAGERVVHVGYLLRAISRLAVDERRRSAGRPRCGLCRSYGWISRWCLRRGSPYTTEVPPGANPRGLAPPCEHFSSVRRCTDLGAPSDGSSSRGDEAERVVRALGILEGRDPAAAAILIEHHLEGRSLRAIARETGCDRRRLARKLDGALRRLGFLLEDLP